MKAQRIFALLLAVALQVLPVCRVAVVNQAVAPSGFAVVLRWLAAATVSLGAFHAVSGASAAIGGVANNSPVGPVSLTATGHVGSAFSYRIIITNPGENPTADYFKAVPLPPGLTINTNVGGDGFITGTPTAAGTNQVTLTAGNTKFHGVVTKNITISISASATLNPPLLLANPQWTNGSFAFDVTGPAQTNFVILTSTNLAVWTPIQTSFTADGTLHFINPTPSPGATFYQATLGP
jgi:hypothetical protein